MSLADSPLPHLRFERAAARENFSAICGIDEAGRGPWAGPVVAAAVILNPRRVPKGINDSKKLSPERREALYAELMDCAEVGVGVADVTRIDRDNILAATMWAMLQAVLCLKSRPDYALVDGNRAPGLSCKTVTIVEGDGTSLSIAAASIVAKVTRDRMMVELHAQFPAYGFARHKGYGTAFHQAALAAHGPCLHHRQSFEPIARLMLR